MLIRLLRAVCCLVAAVLISGCAQNTVPLVYTPTGPDVIPSAGATTVCLVMLNDGRTDTAAIGQRHDSTSFSPSSDVADWISRSLAAELTRQGMIVSLASTEAEAAKSNPSLIVTGTIEDVWLTENSSTSYATRMRVSITVKNTKKTIAKNTFNSSMSRQVVPMPSVPKTMLSETLADLLRPMALFIKQKAS